MDRELLDTFWSFAEGNDNDRINATSKLLDILREKQGQSSEHCKELDYTLDRLLRGLASTRKWARLGFATALTQVLRAFPTVEMKTIMERIPEKLKVLNSETKHEKSNAYLGRILAYLVLIQSDKIHQATDDDITDLVKAIMVVQKKKNPLHQLCSQAIIQLITKMSEEGFAKQVWPLLQPTLNCGWEKCTPDILLTLLTALKHQPGTVDKNFFSDHWGSKKFFAEKNLEAIASVMVQSTMDHPIIHPVCMALLLKAANKSDTFESFWKSVIYGKVFRNGINRKYLVFQLIPEALKLATTDEQIYAILSPSLLKSMMKSLSNKQQVLYGAARKLTQSLVKVSTELTQPSHQVAMVVAMVTSPGTVLFDSISKTRLVSSVLNNLSTAGAKLFSQILMNNIRGEYLTRPYSDDEEKDGTDLLSQQKWSVDMLSNMTSHGSVNKDVAWYTEILQFLFLMAFFDVQKSTKEISKPSAPLEAPLRQVLTSAFFRTLDKVAKSMGKGPGCFQSYCDVLHNIVLYAQSLLDSDKVKLTKNLDENVLSAWETTTAQVDSIKKKREKNSLAQNDEMAFELLFLHHGLQLFTDSKSAMDVLQELHTCYKKASQKKRRRSIIVKPGEEPEWVDVVIDLLMSLLSQQNHLMRTVVNTVFTMLCPHLTKDNVGLILEVLQPSTNSEESPLDFEEEESNAEDDDSDTSLDSEEDEKAEDEDEKDEAKKQGVNEKFRESVKSALGKAADTSSEEEDEESDMEFDDDMMFKLDGALTAAFKGMTKSKKQQAEKDMQLKHYRMRCLDLLEILIHHTTSASLLLHLVYPLLNLMETGIKEKNQKDLGDRATKVFHQLRKIKKCSVDPDLDKSDLPKMVKSLMENSTKVSAVPLVKEVASACVIVLHIVSGQEQTGPSPLKTRAKKQKQHEKQNEDTASMDNILNIVEEGLNNFCLKRDSHMSQYFFQTMLETEPVLMWPLSATILKHAVSPDVRIFCRTQACSMLSAMITKNAVPQLEMNSWIKFAEEIISNTYKILNSGVKQILKPRYVTELLILLHKVISVLNVDLTKKLVKQDLVDLLSRLKSSSTSSGRQAINRIYGLFHARTGNPSTKKKEKKRKRKNQGDKSPSNGALSPSTSSDQQNSGDTTEPPKKKRIDSSSKLTSQAKPTTSMNGASVEASSNSHKKKKRRKSDSGIENQTEEDVPNMNSSSSHKKKQKAKSEGKLTPSPMTADLNSFDFQFSSQRNDKVKLNLAKKLAAAEGKSAKKRRNSEIVKPSIDLGQSSGQKKKKKRKSMGDIS